MARSVRETAKTEFKPLSKSSRSNTKQQLQEDKIDNNFINYVDAEEQHSASKLRKAVSQYYAVTITSLLAITYGLSVGFTTILTHELKNDTQIVDVTDDEITWIGSMNYFSTPLGALVGGPLAQRWGRKWTLLLMSVPYVFSWALIGYSDSVHAILLAFFVIGAVGGVIDPSLQVYVTEVSEPRLRGAISCFVTSTIMLGVFLQTILGSLVDWRSLALYSAAAPTLGLLLIGLVPESPYWLASKGRVEEAEHALCRLRGWTTPQHVKHEFSQILDSTSRGNDSNVDGGPSKPSTSGWLGWIADESRRMRRRAVLLPFALVNFAFFVSCFNGSTSVLTYALDTFALLDSPLDIHAATIVFTALQLLGSLLLPFLVPRVGKRRPTFVSLVVTGFAYLVVAAYVFLRDRAIFEVGSSTDWLRWIPTLAIEISILATTLGIETTPWILVGEVFPGDVRDCATGVVTSTGFVYAALASKTYLWMLQLLTTAGTFLFFATVNFVGLFVLYAFMPETEGRSLAEIEAHFAGVRRLEDGPGPEGTELLPIHHPEKQKA